MKHIKLDDQYTLTYFDVDNWNIYRNDGSLVNKNNLPDYVTALVLYIITGSHL